MKTKFKWISIIICILMISTVVLTACNSSSETKYTVTFDSNGGSVVTSQEILSGETATEPQKPTKAASEAVTYTFDYWCKDKELEQKFSFDTKITSNITLYAKYIETANIYTVKFDTDSDSKISEIEVEHGKTVAKPADPVKSGFVFKYWSTEKAGTTEFDFSTTIIKDITLYAKYEVDNNNYEIVENILDMSLLPVSTLAEDHTQGAFTISKGAAIENSSKTSTDNAYQFTKAIKMGGSHTFSINCGGEGTVVLYVSSGSSSDSGTFIVNVAKDGGTQVPYTLTKSTGDTPEKLEIQVEKGIYEFKGNGRTIRIWYAQSSCMVEKGHESGFEITNTGKTDYLVGDTIDTSNIIVSSLNTNGNVTVLDKSAYSVDASGVNASQSGQYNVKVSYGDYSEQQYTIKVFEPQDIFIYDYKIEKENNIWGNSSYNKKSLKTIYSIGDSFTSENLSVKVEGKLDDETKIFSASNPTITHGFNGSVASKYDITVGAYSLSKNYSVYVVVDSVNILTGVAKVGVDAAYSGVLGAVDNDKNMFVTLWQALQFLENANLSEDVVKEIYIAGGEYYEKIDITLPNVKLIGDSSNKAKITFDGANGKLDPVGTQFNTDGSATFSVRDTAFGFCAYNIIFDNYYNTLERYNALKAITSGTQGIAVLVQADMALFQDCELYGFQDTLQVQGSGRQYFKDCLIVGATDFIFGTNTSVMFEGCEIRTLFNGQSDNGGYVFATKGYNKSANTDVTINGLVINNCKFTSDASVISGKTSIARPWGINSTISIINSELAGHISTEGYISGSTKGQRYVDMSGTSPLLDTISFTEYNNIGDGSIAEAVAGMSILTAQEAQALVDNFFKGYTMENGLNGESFVCLDWTPATI